jgi:hypothetical protein
MAQAPRWYREQQLRAKLVAKNILGNPYADISSVQAANQAIQEKLDQQDRDNERHKHDLMNEYLKLLSND